ncbi:BREX-1 system adenine-specific DNA-methyltransferase PglX [Xanthomonas prunicola]|uniref:BREX-1 system adenine-specific DNA-methyltransferase PglX n=1 Tax=Xanthomonas prunicola TaxID=2053930 RepID=UPI0021B2A562|nr:BREX-1 system adenine-specific DNA-methyltransferase PglX [Xanthomonas prunicola]UXA52318.1 BREX-1 system adenine-specific DNA-methyltransferase PglX [Xanthomonas prunicola]
MQALDKDLRSALEKTVKAARTVAETAANAAVEQLGVGHDKPEAFLSDDEKALRNRLRTHGKQLGDARDSKSTNPTYGKQALQHLVQEVAYQHWHRMLFARFLADNNLLMYDGVAVTIEECDELAPDEGAKSGWELAGRLAARMLPQVFKPGSPVFELTFAPEHQSELERLLKDLPDAVFKASDSLGWVYQFWQADNKERINKLEVKIGADELPAVTQLFTEPYMVAFLLHNSLGAWWATRYPGKPCPVNLDYFRTLEDGTPAAGKFEGWPDSLADFKLLDPCCGSGHFLVAAFLMLVPMRMAAEGLPAKEAVNRVLAENIHGLELDPRCVEIAVFAVALEAWRYPDEHGQSLGVREIPAPNIACCGLKVAAKAEDWQALVSDDATNAAHLREGLARLHQLFAQAPLLGSLLSPGKTKGDLFGADYRELGELLRAALAREGAGKRADGDIRDVEAGWDSAISALGLLDAARLLDGRYQLVVTNVPYLARGKQSQALKDYSEGHYPAAKNDLANVFLERCLELSREAGVVQIVMPQNWLFLTSYKKQRESLLERVQFNLVSLLGVKGFQTPMWDFNVQLLTVTHAPAPTDFLLRGLDVSVSKVVEEKAALLREGELVAVSQKGQLSNPDARIAFGEGEDRPLLSKYADGLVGLQTSDDPMFISGFWEHPKLNRDVWELMQGTPEEQKVDAGASWLVRWEKGEGLLLSLPTAYPTKGLKAVGRHGVAIHRMGRLFPYTYAKERFHQNVAVVIPKDEQHLPAIWCFCSSPEYNEAVRRIDQKLNVTNATLVKVPFDLERWQQVAADRYPHGLPQPYSDDPTQWIFHGHPQPATDPLQVAVARLLGYCWPAESDAQMELSDEARDWVTKSATLTGHADKDGIVCIPPLGREASAADRLLNLLAEAYGPAWNNEMLAQLLSAADHAGKSLETWLREKFFTQHCALFGNRPFAWHIWDGLRDGFAALVNYHKLDYKTLETLIYTYLGDWISRQKRDADNGVDGAQEKLAAAEALKKRLELILAGEARYDIFVRWKPIEQQPIGWNPDLNDGVRLNIRPFLSVPDVGKKGAGVLRDRPKIKWDKDRGSDAPSAPWYVLGLHYGGKVGDRINDHHLSLDEKRKAREKAK